MRAVCLLSEKTEKYEIIQKFQLHLPYILECCRSSKNEIEFTNYAI